MSRPVVSDAAERLYAQLRPYQEGDEDGGWILLHMCEASARMLAKSNAALRQDDQGSGGRRMLDPDRAPAWALPWLAQFVGLPATPWPATETEQRTLIRDAPNLHRGTRAAMTAAAQRHLTGTKMVIFAERAGGAYQLTVVTRTSETPDSSLVEAALLEQKPAGLVLDFQVVTGETWLEAVATWGTVDGALTWADALTTTI